MSNPIARIALLAALVVLTMVIIPRKMEFHYLDDLDHSLGLGRCFVAGKLPAGHQAIFQFIARHVGGAGTPRTLSAPGTGSIKDELLAADKAFAQAAAEKGLEGWMSFMANDAARSQQPGGKLVTGKEAIRQQDAAIFANPKRKLTWAPVDAHAFADGKNGVTSGRYQVVARGDDGKDEVVSSGGYVTWWRKEADGQWKVIFDAGSQDPGRQTK